MEIPENSLSLILAKIWSPSKNLIQPKFKEPTIMIIKDIKPTKNSKSPIPSSKSQNKVGYRHLLSSKKTTTSISPFPKTKLALMK